MSINDLPIYKLKEASKKEILVQLDGKQQDEPGMFSDFIRSTRQSACSLVKSFQSETDSVITYVDKTEKNVISQLNYIQNDTNIIPKFVFISLAGFGGMLLGFRRSKLRKLFYGVTFGTAAAALCYPKEAKIYSGQAYELGKAKVQQLYREFNAQQGDKAKQPVASKPATIEVSAPSAKDKLVKLDASAIKSGGAAPSISGDKGQSSDADKDMYTTRK